MSTKFDEKIKKMSEDFQRFRKEKYDLDERERVVNQEKIDIVLNKILLFIDCCVKKSYTDTKPSLGQYNSEVEGYFIVQGNKVFYVTQEEFNAERRTGFTILNKDGDLYIREYKYRLNSITFTKDQNVFVSDESIPITKSFTEQINNVIKSYLKSCEILEEMKDDGFPYPKGIIKFLD
jgi:hypothetical protein